MATKAELIKQAEKLGVKVSAKATKAQIEQALVLAEAKAIVTKVERPVRKRGRKSIVKPGMIALVNSWDSLEVGDSVLLPDAPALTEGMPESQRHSLLTLARYHFKKYAKDAGLSAGQDYTVEYSPEHGAVLTRLR